jgi:uncharacterized membrane protein
MRSLEESTALDGVVAALSPVAEALLASPARRDLLHGRWQGHAAHPLLTDLPVGFWTSSFMLDLLGGRQGRDASRRLVGWGVLSAVPTALTGLAEWGATGERERRVGVVHALANSVALGLYTGSWLARRRDQHARGVALGLAGSAAATVGGYLGGHLAAARKVSTRHPAFATDTAADAGPEVLP